MGHGEVNLILIIEDEPIQREMMMAGISSAGFKTITAANGHEGYDLIVSRRPSLVVSDVKMPEMSGFDLLNKVRVEHPELSMMPIIFVTGLDDLQDKTFALALGADDYVTKPVDFALLIPMIWGRLKQIRRISDFHDVQLAKVYRRLTGFDGPQDDAAELSDEADAVADQAPQPSPQEIAAAPPDDAEQPSHAIVCTSDSDTGRSVAEVLGEHGREVVEIGQGSALLDSLAERRPKIVFLSHVTKDMAGFYVAKQIKKQAGDSVAIVLIANPDRKINASQLPNDFDDVINPSSLTEDIGRIRNRFDFR